MTKATGVGRGRPKGARNKRTRESESAVKAAAEKIEQVLPGAFEGNSHAYLMSIYKDPILPTTTRIDAAKAALPFEMPRLAAVEHTTPPGRPMQNETTHKLDKSSAELIANLVK